MTTSAGRNCDSGDRQRYEIRLQGHLNARLADRLDGMVFVLESGGTTRLTGSLADQAALHGLLARIRDLGLSIVSIQRLSPDEEVGNS